MDQQCLAEWQHRRHQLQNPYHRRWRTFSSSSSSVVQKEVSREIDESLHELTIMLNPVAQTELGKSHVPPFSPSRQPPSAAQAASSL